MGELKPWGEYALNIGYQYGIPDDDGETLYCPVELELMPSVLPDTLVADILRVDIPESLLDAVASGEMLDEDVPDILSEGATNAWHRRWAPIVGLPGNAALGMNVGQMVTEAPGEPAFVAVEIDLVFDADTSLADVYMSVQQVSAAIEGWLPQPAPIAEHIDIDIDIDDYDG